ncbi:hypothetical protein Tco_1264679 [Tanacetum coccineum]
MAFYACSDSLLLTPLCCDDIHDVTPRVSALAGCDRLVSEPLVIENYVSLIRKKFCWGTIFPIGLKRYSDPKEEPIKKEPLMELKEIGLLRRVESRISLCTHAKRQGENAKQKCCMPKWCVERLQLMERKEGGGMYLLWVPLIGDVRTFMMDEAHASRVEVGDKVMLEVSSWKEVVHFGKKEMLAPRYKYLADTNLHVHLEEIKVDKTLLFVEEPIEIIDCEVKSLKRSRIPIDEISLRRGYYDNCALSSYACSDSLLLTPLCCDDIHDVTPRVSALAGCDKRYHIPKTSDNYGPIFDIEPLEKVHTADDHYNVFANERQHHEQPKIINDTYVVEQDDRNISPDSPNMCSDEGEADQDDIDKEHVLLASLIEKLKCEIDENKKQNKSLETSNKAFQEANKELGVINMALSNDIDKVQLEIVWHIDMKCVKDAKNDCAKAYGLLAQQKASSEKEYYYADHMNAILGVYTKLDEVTDLLLNSTSSVSRPHLKSNPLEDKVLDNNSQVKKMEVEEDHLRNFHFSKNKTSVTVCNDSLNAKTSNVNFVCVTCGKCVLNDNHALCVLHYINGVNSRAKKPIALLVNFVEKFLGTVRFGNDQFAPILEYGDLVQGFVTMKKVYYVEGLNHNLFSVCQFCDAYLEVAFRKSTCYVHDLKGNDLLTSSRGSDLYSITLQQTTSHNPICLMAKATSSQARLWHRRLKLGFDPAQQCPTTAFEQVSLSPDTQSQANVPIEDETITTSLNELDILFSPMFDEYFNGATSVVSKSSHVPTADASDKCQQANTTSSTSTTVAADSTQLNIQTTPKLSTQAPPVTATENIVQAENVMVDEDDFINIISTPIYEWEQFIGNPSQPVRIRRQLETDGEMCMFSLTVSRTEPKNIKEAMDDHAWIEAMQEELHQFE